MCKQAVSTMTDAGQLLLVCLVICTMDYAGTATEAKVTITCDAPSVVEGQTAQITCNFNRDVSNLTSATITVEHYKGPDPVTVLDCTPVSSGCKIPNPDYQLSSPINTRLVLTIPVALKENAGRYACKMLSPDLKETDDVQPCYLTVKGATTTTVTTTTEGKPPEKGDSLGLIVGVVVVGILALAAVVAAVITCRIKKCLCFSENAGASLTTGKGTKEKVSLQGISDDKNPESGAPNSGVDRDTQRLLNQSALSDPGNAGESGEHKDTSQGTDLEKKKLLEESASPDPGDTGETEETQLQAAGGDDDQGPGQDNDIGVGAAAGADQQSDGALAREDRPEEPNTDADGAKESVTEENRSRNDAEEEEDKDDKEKGPSVLEQVRAIESKQDGS